MNIINSLWTLFLHDPIGYFADAVIIAMLVASLNGLRKARA